MNTSGWGKWARRQACGVGLACAAATMVACGGGDETTVSPPPTPVIGSSGGSVSEASGATVIVPAGALSADTTVRVAMDSTGAPAMPQGLAAAGNTYVITPHGGEFAEPVEVRIPASSAGLQPNEELKLAKAQPGGAWEVLSDSVLANGVLSARVSSFSFFAAVRVSYLLPILQLEPLRVTASLDCGAQPCEGALGPVTATYVVTGNGGQLPAGCTTDQLLIQPGGSGPNFNLGIPDGANERVPLSGGSMTRTLTPRAAPWYFTVAARCAGTGTILNFGPVASRRVIWQREPVYPNLSVMRAPAQLDVVQGLAANLDVVLAGGGNSDLRSLGEVVPPTATNRAVIDWQRSDDNGASWRVVARSYQNEANPNPVGPGLAWKYWSVRHGFVAAGADQGALLRVHACYTPPDVAAPPCVAGPSTRLNVLQQSALPVIVDAPRSVLVRTGQTASLSATASGAPAPTLQWQTRAANASGAWADVSAGAGGSTGNYTTPVLSTADNGTQYRVRVTNALGSAESAPVTVSVSDLDVAPAITTQPAALGVTAGNDAAFAIAARGTEALSYQWQLNGAPIAGANSPVLRLPAVTTGQAGGYRVVVSNSAGTATSQTAVLSVSAGTAAAVAPSIVTQPVAVTVNVGNTATLAVGASGSAPLAFQWLRNGVPIVGATAAFHSIDPVALGDAASYTVSVSNSAGSVTSAAAALAVNTSPQASAVTLTTQPSPQVQPTGGSATLAVAASGSGPLSYQWLKNGVPLAGATAAVLSLTNLVAEDAASYSVTVGNPLGAVTSNAAALTLLGVPAITSQPAAATVAAGGSASFGVAASGSGLRYQWLRNGVAVSGADVASHTTPALALGDSGALYSVLVYNGAGIVFSQTAVLTVTAAGPAWVSPAAIETDDTGDAQAPSLAVNAAGEAVAVWMQSDGAGIHIWANRYTPAAGWGTAQRISDGQGGAQGALSVAIDATGHATAVWQQANDIWSNRYVPGVGWLTPEVIDFNAGWSGSPQIAVDGVGNMLAVWMESRNGRLNVEASRYVAGAGWSGTHTLDSDNTGDISAPQVAVNGAGDAVVAWAWASDTGGGNYVYNVWASRYLPGLGWGDAEPLDSNNTQQPNPAPHVAMGINGNAIVVWHRRDGGIDHVKSSHSSAGTNWSTSLETHQTVVSRNARVAIDATGNAIAVWEQYDGAIANVMASRYNGSGWSSPAPIETDDAGSAYTPQIVFDVNGFGTVLWQQRNAAGFTDNVWLNRYTPGIGWGTAVAIDGQPQPATHPVLGVDASGRLIVVWAQMVGSVRSIWASAFR